MEEQYQYTRTKEIFSRENDLPKLPGVYKFYDEKNKILYIGKAKNLSNRLKSYLSISKDRKKNELIDKIKFLEIFLKFFSRPGRRNSFSESNICFA